jgi:hypothetical protein
MHSYIKVFYNKLFVIRSLGELLELIPTILILFKEFCKPLESL